MTWDDADELEAEIRSACRCNDRERLVAESELLLRRLAVERKLFPVANAKAILGQIRRKREFKLLAQVADGLLRSGQSATRVRRQYGQALIDQGDLSGAITYLEKLAKDTEQDEDRTENREACGLLGRAFKQAFMDAAASQAQEHAAVKTPRDAEHLEKAIYWYASVWNDAREELWHGVNLAALLARAARDGLQPKGYNDPLGEARDIADEIRTAVSRRWQSRAASMWDCATAAESCIVLDDLDGALEWIQRYVREPGVDAFELGSTARQFREVWGLEEDSDGGGVLSVLDAEIMRVGGGDVILRGGSAQRGNGGRGAAQLEKALGKTRYVTYQEYERGRTRARAVARIEDASGNGIGTGFLVRGGDLWQPLEDKLVLLTNAHVVSSDKGVCSPPPLLPSEATASFKLLGGEDESLDLDVAKLLWSSPPGALDTTVLRLAAPLADVTPCPLHRRLPLADGEQRVYLVGHPRGGELSFSLQDNLLIEHEGPPSGKPMGRAVRLHYRAPSDPGSSGSPVFNRQWKLIGIHHAGGLDMPRLNGKQGRYPANEGIWIESIKKAIEADPQDLRV